ncbi:MAG: transposase [Bryobacteraceae bacterium]|jgi:putative transposase
MARLPRVVAAGAAHHITQRGNVRRTVFETDSDHLVYLDLLRQFSSAYELSLVGYCLMPNHVHLVAVPARAGSMPLALRYTHGRYATYLNARQAATGHVWQGRYYSCPLEQDHLWAALRYTELNPVRAGFVTSPATYAWSSAAAHCRGASDRLLDLEVWRLWWTPESWCDFLAAAVTCDAEADQIRASTHTGRPLGSAEFVRDLERTLHRSLVAQKGGRPRKKPADTAQACLGFSASASGA